MMSQLEKNLRNYNSKLTQPFENLLDRFDIDIDSLSVAFTHSSFSNEQNDKIFDRNFAFESYERLEFLGDSVLGFIVSNYLYENMLDADEGELTLKRAEIVCGKALSIVAKKYNLGSFLKIGKGAKNDNICENDNILEDVIEAIIGCVYLNFGLPKTTMFVLALLELENN